MLADHHCQDVTCSKAKFTTHRSTCPKELTRLLTTSGTGGFNSIDPCCGYRPFLVTLGVHSDLSVQARRGIRRIDVALERAISAGGSGIGK